VFLTDAAVSVAKAFRLDRRLTQIDEVAAALRLVSDRLGGSMADGALTLKARDGRTRKRCGRRTKRRARSFAPAMPSWSRALSTTIAGS
jgi:SLT domain-containing protein